MEIKESRELTGGQKADVLELWNAEYPTSIAHPDMNGLDHYLAEL